jgi:hypothetical protein
MPEGCLARSTGWLPSNTASAILSRDAPEMKPLVPCPTRLRRKQKRRLCRIVCAAETESGKGRCPAGPGPLSWPGAWGVAMATLSASIGARERGEGEAGQQENEAGGRGLYSTQLSPPRPLYTPLRDDAVCPRAALPAPFRFFASLPGHVHRTCADGALGVRG